jgi:hypothetical protein
MKGISILNFLISLRKELSYSYQNQRTDFYNTLLAFRNLNGLVKKFDEFQSSDNIVITQQNISPLGLKFNDSQQKCDAKLGKARFEATFNKSQNYQVSFYRLIMRTEKIIVQLHFINNQLIYIRIQFDKLDIHQDIREQVLHSIFYKYELSYSSQPHEIIIKDRHDNTLKCMDYGVIFIEYFSGLPSHKTLLELIKNENYIKTKKTETMLDFI